MKLPGRGDAPSGFTSPIVLTEADCGFCQKSIAQFEKYLPGDWQNVRNNTVDVTEFGLTQKDIERAAWWVEVVDNNIRVYPGAKNFGALMIRNGGWQLPIGLLTFIPPFSWIAWGIYQIIAKNRGRLPGSTPSCGLPSQPQ
ncbi:MAG: hypothetical protein RIS09_1362 [Actinomycetota bacterium]|jgi:predicted DCC family thiol-disulfide oxidoreductase YuxK